MISLEQLRTRVRDSGPVDSQWMDLAIEPPTHFYGDALNWRRPGSPRVDAWILAEDRILCVDATWRTNGLDPGDQYFVADDESFVSQVIVAHRPNGSIVRSALLRPMTESVHERDLDRLQPYHPQVDVSPELIERWQEVRVGGRSPSHLRATFADAPLELVDRWVTPPVDGQCLVHVLWRTGSDAQPPFVHLELMLGHQTAERHYADEARRWAED